MAIEETGASVATERKSDENDESEWANFAFSEWNVRKMQQILQMQSAIFADYANPSNDEKSAAAHFQQWSRPPVLLEQKFCTLK